MSGSFASSCGPTSAKGRRDQARKVRLSAFLVGERVENPEGRSIDLKGVPDDGTGLLLDDRAAALEECLDLGLLAGLGLHQRENSHGQRHVVLLCSTWAGYQMTLRSTDFTDLRVSRRATARPRETFDRPCCKSARSAEGNPIVLVRVCSITFCSPSRNPSHGRRSVTGGLRCAAGSFSAPWARRSC